MKILAISLVSDRVSTQVQKTRRARIPVAMKADRVVTALGRVMLRFFKLYAPGKRADYSNILIGVSIAFYALKYIIICHKRRENVTNNGAVKE